MLDQTTDTTDTNPTAPADPGLRTLGSGGTSGTGGGDGLTVLLTVTEDSILFTGSLSRKALTGIKDPVRYEAAEKMLEKAKKLWAENDLTRGRCCLHVSLELDGDTCCPVKIEVAEDPEITLTRLSTILSHLAKQC